MTFRKYGLVRCLVGATAGAVLMISGLHNATAQSSATANASATIVTAISISKTTDLQFGAIVPGPGGNVVLSTSSSRSATGVSLLSSSSFPVSAALFGISGGPNLAYSITLPTSTILTGPSSATMTVNTFVGNPSSSGTLDSGGNGSLSVGATLTVGAGQTAGAYTGTFSVTVNYQ